MSRHRLRYVLPSSKRMTFLGWRLWSSNGFAEYDSLGIDNLLTNLKDSLISIDSEFSRYLNVMCRHCLWQALPTGERMTLLLRIRLSGQSSAVQHVRLLIGGAVESVSEMIRRYGKLGSKRNILLSDRQRTRVVRHVVRPLYKVMTLGRRCGERQRSALSQTTATLVNRSAISS